MATNTEILAAISSTEPCTFGEFLDGLPEQIAKGDTEQWRELFRQLRLAEAAGYIEIERSGQSIESLMLTGEGAEVVRRAQR